MIHESEEPEFAAVALQLRTRHENRMRAVIDRAIARGEVSRAIQSELLVPLVLFATYGKVFMNKESADDLFVTRVVDVLLLGALPRI